MNRIDFTHHYHKLKNSFFTTIRGKSHAKNLKENQEVEIWVDGERDGSAVILGWEVKRLIDIDLKVLKDDGEYPGFLIWKHREFMGLINSMRKWEKSKLKSVEDEVCVIWLGRVDSVCSNQTAVSSGFQTVQVDLTEVVTPVGGMNMPYELCRTCKHCYLAIRQCNESLRKKICEVTK